MRVRTVAIIGSGPAGFYAAEAALKSFGANVAIDILDRLPTPYGLIRAGVAPDHQSIKAVQKRYHQVASDARVRFLGCVEVGRDIALADLQALYDDVILAVGAPADRRLHIAGDTLPGVLGSGAFVGWYNGHPDFHQLAPVLGGETAVVIGNGNVAIDCARILAKTVAELTDSDITNRALQALGDARHRHIHILGRRGPQQTSFTLQETKELGELARATPLVDPAAFPPVAADEGLDTRQRRVVEVLRHFAAIGPDPDKPVTLHLDFFQRPLAILGDKRVEGVRVMRTRLDESGRAVDTGDSFDLPCSLVLTAIGYRSTPLAGVPFDDERGRFRNDDGAISPGLWCVGWARRGPTGTIGTNRTDAISLMERLAATPARGGGDGPAGLDRRLAAAAVPVSGFADWLHIDAMEVARARPGAPREKFAALGELQQAIAAGRA